MKLNAYSQELKRGGYVSRKGLGTPALKQSIFHCNCEPEQEANLLRVHPVRRRRDQ